MKRPHQPLYTGILLCLSLIAFQSCNAPRQVIGTANGNKAPEIQAPDMQGKMLTLSALKGSYVLVEFWDSGNTTARENHMEMQRMYKKYKDAAFKEGDGFCIFSVSLDKDKNQWIEAIQNDQITWPCQVNDFKAWFTPSALAYDISFVPQYYLVDGNGNIIRKNIMINQLASILEDELQGRL
ncbi:MAG: TlpA disulfide reductase family protein [Chitinophagales bacterium]